MEYWSVEKKDINPLAITPLLHHSNTPMLQIESAHHRFFGLSIRK